MENSLVKSVLNTCKTLNEHSVEYLIVGGTAVGFYGYYRGSTASDGSSLGKHDLDFWYNPILENYYKLLDAIESLGIDVSKHRKGIAVPKQSFFSYEFDEYKTVFLQAQVTSFIEESADFSKYKTYSFLGWQQHSDSLLSDIDKERLQKAFKSEFDARNLKYVQSGGDMLVSLYIFLDVKSDSTTYIDFVERSSMTPIETTIHGGDYEEGTLILDCYDARETTLIFQGKKVKTIRENPSKREITIPKAVAKLMRKFPLEKSK